MTTKTNGKRTSVSIATAILLLLSALVFLLPTVAYADGGSGEADSGESESGTPICDMHPDGNCYQNIYYFSDCDESEFYMDMYLRGLFDTYISDHMIETHYYWYDLKSQGKPDDIDYIAPRFGSSMYDFHHDENGYSTLGYYGIENSLVIYELRELMPMQAPNGGKYVVTEYLEDIFRRMREKGCKIMFVCGTDEVMYEQNNNNAFLDYVDIHINTDIYSYFINTFLNHFERAGMSGSTIILDKSMSQYVYDDGATAYTHNACWDFGSNPLLGSRYGFFNITFIPYLRLINSMFTNDENYDEVYEVLEACDIRVLCHVSERKFFDMEGNITIDLDTMNFDPDYYFKGRSIYFLGTTRLGVDLYMQETIGFIEDYFDLNIAKYVFTEKYSMSYDFKPTLYTAGLDEYSMACFLYPMMNDVLFDFNNLASYDNWRGRCDITVKPTSEDGWLEDFDNDDEKEYIYNNAFEEEYTMFGLLYFPLF